MLVSLASRFVFCTKSRNCVVEVGPPIGTKEFKDDDARLTTTCRSFPFRFLFFCVAVSVILLCNVMAWTPASRADLFKAGDFVPSNRQHCVEATSEGLRWEGASADGRIQIRQVKEGPQFYNTRTGTKFIPRGNNYIRLARLQDPWGGHNFGHSLFDPIHYNAQCAQAALSAMRSKGYNVVRVFVSEISSGSQDGPGLNIDYMRNLADFLRIAKKLNIRVIVVFWRLPRQGGYQPTIPPPTTMEGVNAYFLHQPFIDAKKRYVRDFLSELKAQDAPLEVVLAWDLENEAHFTDNKKPLALVSGNITIANGKIFNMADANDRRRIVEEGLVYWAEQVSAGVKEIDPKALVTMSFFSPASVDGDDPRITWTRKVISDPEVGGSPLDLVDIHLYPGSIQIEDELESFEITKSRKPIILGEMGIWMPPVTKVDRPIGAIDLLRRLQVRSCEKRFRVIGWVLYSWDTLETAIGRRDIYTASDNDWEIADRLSPSKLYEPCADRSFAQLH